MGPRDERVDDGLILEEIIEEETEEGKVTEEMNLDEGE